MADTHKALLIKINNPADLARSQGALAGFAQQLAPATIEAKIYDTMKAKIADSFKAQGVDADISIVEPSAFTHASVGHVAQDIAYGMGFLGLAGLVWYLLQPRKR
jgi:hypothetical protein